MKERESVLNIERISSDNYIKMISFLENINQSIGPNDILIFTTKRFREIFHYFMRNNIETICALDDESLNLAIDKIIANATQNMPTKVKIVADINYFGVEMNYAIKYLEKNQIVENLIVKDSPLLKVELASFYKEKYAILLLARYLKYINFTGYIRPNDPYIEMLLTNFLCYDLYHINKENISENTREYIGKLAFEDMSILFSISTSSVVLSEKRLSTIPIRKKESLLNQDITLDELSILENGGFIEIYGENIRIMPSSCLLLAQELFPFFSMLERIDNRWPDKKNKERDVATFCQEWTNSKEEAEKLYDKILSFWNLSEKIGNNINYWECVEMFDIFELCNREQLFSRCQRQSKVLEFYRKRL